MATYVTINIRVEWKDGDVMNEVMFRKIEQKLEDRKRNLPSFVHDFLDSLETSKTIQTQLEYVKDIQLFLEFLIESEIIQKSAMKEITTDDLQLVQADDINAFLEYLTHYKKTFLSVAGNKTVQEFSNGPRGKERKRVSIHRLYDYLIQSGLLKKNPVFGIQIKVEKYTSKPRLTGHELHQMFETALHKNPDEFRALRNCVILKILSYTGIRISELTNLDVDDIWRNRNEMVVTRKNGEKESIYINSEIQTDLYRYLDKRMKIENIQKGHREALFLSQQMRRLDPKSVRKMINKTAALSKVDIHVTPQTFRRTFGWRHYHQFQNIELTAGLLGNISTETARHQYANPPKRKESATQ